MLRWTRHPEADSCEVRLNWYEEPAGAKELRIPVIGLECRYPEQAPLLEGDRQVSLSVTPLAAGKPVDD